MEADLNVVSKMPGANTGKLISESRDSIIDVLNTQGKKMESLP